jgi:chromosome partitioning protein
MPQTKRAATYLDKGGTGKTTITAHLASCLADDHEVLALDLAGKQGDLGLLLGVYEDVQEDIDEEDDWPNISTVFDERWHDIAESVGHETAVNKLIYESEEGVDVIPAHPGLDGLDSELGNIDNPSKRYGRLREFLDEYVDPLGYDIILLDLPGLSNNVSYNGLWAAENVIAPVKQGELELKQARRVRKDLEAIRERDDYDATPELVYLIPNLFDARTNLDDEILDDFKTEFGDVIGPAVVKDSQQIANATRDRRTIFALEDDELSSTGREARTAIETTADNLLTRL